MIADKCTVQVTDRDLSVWAKKQLLCRYSRESNSLEISSAGGREEVMKVAIAAISRRAIHIRQQDFADIKLQNLEQLQQKFARIEVGRPDRQTLLTYCRDFITVGEELANCVHSSTKKSVKLWNNRRTFFCVVSVTMLILFGSTVMFQPDTALTIVKWLSLYCAAASGLAFAITKRAPEAVHA